METSNAENGAFPVSSPLPANAHTSQQGGGDRQEQSLEAIHTWLVTRLAEYLDLEPSEIDIHALFASYGLRSVDAVSLSGDLEDWLGRELSPTVMYDYPDIALLARYLVGESNATVSRPTGLEERTRSVGPAEPIAIIGMACRFPGNANSPEQFWTLLQRGGEAIADEAPAWRWDKKEYYDPDPDAPGKMYTSSGGFIADLDCFDARFFGISPREAKRMDPQHRLLLEVAWEALERAGLAPERLAGSSTGVFVGMMTNQEYSLLQADWSTDFVDDPYFGLGGAASVAAGRLPYLFDFHGPTLSLDTACSSSLVSVHLACQSLRNDECNLALAAGVNAIVWPENVVNACKMGMLSLDGHCRPFDSQANGFVLGEGCGVVVLKRLADAVADHDPVLAVIRGSAVNQDGRSNGLTAPNPLAQQDVIRRALIQADIEPWQVGYVEAHGSGTALGDPIEAQALVATLGEGRSMERPLMVGAVKANIGHLAGAAGIAGLIKTVLVLQHQEIPPHPNLCERNPHIPWQDSPISVPTQLTCWPSQDGVNIAGVSSFGWSGTNAHVLLEAAPAVMSTGSTSPLPRPCHLVTLSAKTASALEKLTENFLHYIKHCSEVNLADVAYTMQVGRNAFQHRRVLVCDNLREAALETWSITQQLTDLSPRPVAFLFPGQVEQSVGMAQELYQQESVFREVVDQCSHVLNRQFGLDMRALLYPSSAEPASVVDSRIGQTAIAQPALFIIEYALARLLISWGIRPSAMLGQSLGEYVAACLAGVLSLDDALTLVAQRALLIQALPQGALLEAQGEALTLLARTIDFHKPQIPYISNVTGTWITEEQATDPTYWAQQMCQAVRLADGVGHLLQETEHLLLEVGPGLSLSSLVKQHPACTHERILSTLSRQSAVASTEYACLLENVGRLWLAGVVVDWVAFSAREQRRCVPSLPTYPFERQRYWIDASAQRTRSVSRSSQDKKADIADWFYLPAWEKAPLPENVPGQQALPSPCLLFLDDLGIGEQLAHKLERSGVVVIRVYAGEHFAQLNKRHFTLRSHEAADYQELVDALAEARLLPEVTLHLWSLSASGEHIVGRDSFSAIQKRGFYSHLFLVHALGTQIREQPVQMLMISNNMQEVTGQERLQPEKATLLGACTVVSQEYADIQCRSIDLLLPDSGSAEEGALLDALLSEYALSASEPAMSRIAYRDGTRWRQEYVSTRLVTVDSERVPLRSGGVYLITGGLGELGLVVAEHLASAVQARLVLTSRSGLPPRMEWQRWLAEHESVDRTSDVIRRIQRLEALGAEVLAVQADVADAARMQEVIEQTETLFGRLHGVIHAAGITSSSAFRPVATLTRQECEQHYQPKVYGLFVLEQVLEGHSLDFCLLFSSISSVLGGLSFASYAAANCFMDAYVGWHNQTKSTPWISVNWESWQTEQGSLKRSEQEEQGGLKKLGSTIADYAMDTQEGLEVLTRVLANSHLTRLITSTGDLHARIQQWVELESLATADRQQAVSHKGQKISGKRADMPMPTSGEMERVIADIWRKALGTEQVGLYDNFFDLGGNSLIGLQVLAQLKKAFHVQLSVVALFEAPTISALVQLLQPPPPVVAEKPVQCDELVRRRQACQGNGRQDIAIIGLAGRFPGAANVEQFWDNLRNGVESITFFSDEELLAAGIEPHLLRDPNYVGARPILSDVEHFDAAFFGYSPREAKLMDPQHRLFLESNWEALERAGYDPQTYRGLIGVFGGANISTYLLGLATHSHILETVDDYSLVISNDKDSLTTSVSYKLNLRGPSFAVQTFCSTSLVAIHLACQSLRVGECDMALAGGVSVRVPVIGGHLYQEGGMESPDGHVRTFDAQAGGSMFGDGVGVVVLKRLEEAIADGDQIDAVIKGSAINNDGSLKVSYTAPSVNGQAEVVQAALEQAGVEAESISYVEAHGTATELGDPIEVAALTKAYRRQTEREQYCAIGSVKTNIGHLDRAAGVSGLIKTVLALQHEELPPSLHYQRPNPAIDFEHSPFYVNARLSSWKRGEKVRRAGLNSLGMGGTNVHMVVEEAPEREVSGPARDWKLLLVSAKTETALAAATENLRAYLQTHQQSDVADVAYTLQIGRQRFEHRRVVLCRNREEAVCMLQQAQENGASHNMSRREQLIVRPVAFLFPGVGEQYVGMARELYQQEAMFREIVEQCCHFLSRNVGLDVRDQILAEKRPVRPSQGQQNGSHSLRTLLGRHGGEKEQRGVAVEERACIEQAAQLKQTVLAQPAVFIVEYALAQLLLSWGIRPSAMMGYSLGEYVAACLAGVLTLEDALTLVARRAQLIQECAPGAMLAVALAETDVRSYLSKDISLAAINAPTTCVLSGSVEAIERLEARLAGLSIAHRRVETTHAFHSSLLENLREPLTDLVRTMSLHEPAIPYLSNVTGTWITAEQATNPAYWAQHMCQTVRFADGVTQLLQQDAQVLLEVGPGQSLSSFVKQHPACEREHLSLICSTQLSRFEMEQQSEHACLLRTLGTLWLLGVAIDWAGFSDHERRHRLSLPTYPFERQRYWIEIEEHAQPNAASKVSGDGELKRIPDIGDWFFLPSWKQSLPSAPFQSNVLSEQTDCWLVLTDPAGIGRQLGERLVACGQDVITVLPGPTYARKCEDTYAVRTGHREDYAHLLAALRERGKTPTRVIHLWSVTPSSGYAGTELAVSLGRGLYSLLALAQALGDLVLERSCEITVISQELQNVTGNERLSPEKATILGPCRVISQEYSTLSCRSIDICLPESGCTEELTRQLLGEIVSGSGDNVVALRGDSRWVQSFESVRVNEPREQTLPLRTGGVYLITGGLGGIGLAVAGYLARTLKAKLVLVGRSGLPARSEWSTLCETQADADGIGRQIRQVQELEAAGSEVLVIPADVTCETQMRAVVRQARAMFGDIHGVIHAAGVPGAGLIQLKTREAVARVLAPKVQGTLVLERVLADLPLDFLALFSSITAVTGGPGQMDYCAANAFLDAYARRSALLPGLTVAINWSEWQWDAWGDGLMGYGEEAQRFFKEHRQKFGLSFAEGIEAFRRALSCQISHVVVCPQHFPTLVEKSRAFTTTSMVEKEQQKPEKQALHPRPAVVSSYVPPRNGPERQIIAVWEELLGISPIGVNDNFFDLGGNSLTGVDLMARLRRIFKLETLAAYVLYEVPSVSAMANYIEQGSKTQLVEETLERGEKRRENLKLRMRETGRMR